VTAFFWRGRLIRRVQAVKQVLGLWLVAVVNLLFYQLCLLNGFKFEFSRFNNCLQNDWLFRLDRLNLLRLLKWWFCALIEIKSLAFLRLLKFKALIKCEIHTFSLLLGKPEINTFLDRLLAWFIAKQFCRGNRWLLNLIVAIILDKVGKWIIICVNLGSNSVIVERSFDQQTIGWP
jgi:hypothetical protein